VLAPSAHAAPGDTIATFTITGGALNISVPSSTVNLGSVGTGQAAGGPWALGATTVTDTRGALIATWTVTVTSTDFNNTTTGGSTAAEKVTAPNVLYTSGAATATTGLGAFVPGTTAGSGGTGIGAAHASAAGNNSATWNPTLTFTLLSSQVAGVYSGTINQSVA